MLTGAVIDSLLTNDALTATLCGLEQRLLDALGEKGLRAKRKRRSHFLCWLFAGASRIVSCADLAAAIGGLAGQCIKSGWVKKKCFQDKAESAEELLAEAVNGAIAEVVNVVAAAVGGHLALQLAVVAVLVCPDPDHCPAATGAECTVGKAVLGALTRVEFGGEH